MPNIVGARSLVETAYKTIRRDILNGNIGPGTTIHYEMLRERYDFGAPTLRQVLNLLLGEALVTSEEQRAFRVPTISLADLADLTRARKLIEVEALRQAILFGDEGWEAHLVEVFHRLTKIEETLQEGPARQNDGFEEHNRDFHVALIAACPSRWLKSMHSTLFQQMECYRRISRGNPIEDRNVHAEHKAVIDAVLNRDVDLACRLIGEHIDMTLDVLIRIVRSGEVEGAHSRIAVR